MAGRWRVALAVLSAAALASAGRFDKYRTCEDCIAAGLGWSHAKQKCGGWIRWQRTIKRVRRFVERLAEKFAHKNLNTVVSQWREVFILSSSRHLNLGSSACCHLMRPYCVTVT